MSQLRASAVWGVQRRHTGYLARPPLPGPGPSLFLAVAERAIVGLSPKLRRSAPASDNLEDVSLQLAEAGLYAESAEFVRTIAKHPGSRGAVTPAMRGSALVAAVRAGRPMSAMQPARHKRSFASPHDAEALTAAERCSLVLALLQQGDIQSALKFWPASTSAELRFITRTQSQRQPFEVHEWISPLRLATTYHQEGLGTALAGAVSAIRAAGGGPGFVSTVMELLAGGAAVPPEALPPLLATLCTAESAAAAPHIVGLIFESISVAAAAAGQTVSTQLQLVEYLEMPLRLSADVSGQHFFKRYQRDSLQLDRWSPFLSVGALQSCGVPPDRRWRAGLSRSAAGGSAGAGFVARGPPSDYPHPAEALVRECVLAAPLPPLVYASLLRACVIADAPDAAVQLLEHAEASMLFRRALDEAVGFGSSWVPGRPASSQSDSDFAIEDLVRACLVGAGAHAVERAATGLLRRLAPGAPEGLRYADVDEATILAVSTMLSRHGRSDEAFAAFRWHLRARAEKRVAAHQHSAAEVPQASPASAGAADSKTGTALLALGTLFRGLPFSPQRWGRSSVPLPDEVPAPLSFSAPRVTDGWSAPPIPSPDGDAELPLGRSSPLDPCLVGAPTFFRDALASACNHGRTNLRLETAVSMCHIAGFFGIDAAGVIGGIGQIWTEQVKRTAVAASECTSAVSANVESSRGADGEASVEPAPTRLAELAPWRLCGSEEAVSIGPAVTYARLPGAALLAGAARLCRQREGGSGAEPPRSLVGASLDVLSAPEAAELPHISLAAADVALGAMHCTGRHLDVLSLWRSLGDTPLGAVRDLARQQLVAEEKKKKVQSLQPFHQQETRRGEKGSYSRSSASSARHDGSDSTLCDEFDAALAHVRDRFASVSPDDAGVELTWAATCLPGVLASVPRAPPGALAFLAPLQRVLIRQPGLMLRSADLVAAWLESLGYGILLHVPDPEEDAFFTAQDDALVQFGLPPAQLPRTAALEPSRRAVVAQGVREHLEMFLHAFLLIQREAGAGGLKSSPVVAQALASAVLRLTVAPPALLRSSLEPALAPALRDVPSSSSGAVSNTLQASFMQLPSASGPWHAVVPSDATLVTVINALAKGGFAFDHSRVRATAVLSALGVDADILDVPFGDTNVASRVYARVLDVIPVATPALARRLPGAAGTAELDAPSTNADDALRGIASDCRRIEGALLRVRRAVYFWHALQPARDASAAALVPCTFWAGYAIINAASLLASEAQALFDRMDPLLYVDPSASHLQPIAAGSTLGGFVAESVAAVSAQALDLRDLLIVHAWGVYAALLAQGGAAALDAVSAHNALVAALVGKSEPPDQLPQSLAMLNESVRGGHPALLRGQSPSERLFTLVAAGVLVSSTLERAGTNPALRAAALRGVEIFADGLFAYTAMGSTTPLSALAAARGAVADPSQLKVPRIVARSHRPFHSSSSVSDVLLPGQVVTLTAACERVLDLLLLGGRWASRQPTTAGDSSATPEATAAVSHTPLRQLTVEKLVSAFAALGMPVAAISLLAAVRRPAAPRSKPYAWPAVRLPPPRPLARPLLPLIKQLPKGWDEKAAVGDATRLVETAVTGIRFDGGGAVMSVDGSRAIAASAAEAVLNLRIVETLVAKAPPPPLHVRPHRRVQPPVHATPCDDDASARNWGVRRGLEPSAHALFRVPFFEPQQSPGSADVPTEERTRSFLRDRVRAVQAHTLIVIGGGDLDDSASIQQTVLGDAIYRAIRSCTVHDAPPAAAANIAPLFAEALRLDAPLPGPALLLLARWASEACPELLPLLAEWTAGEAYAATRVMRTMWPRRNAPRSPLWGLQPPHVWDLVGVAASGRDPLAALVLFDAVCAMPDVVFPPDLAHHAEQRALRELESALRSAGTAYSAAYDTLRQTRPGPSRPA